MNIEQALLNPSREFSCPADVFREPSLSREQTIKILRQWEYDARELSVAEEENMAGGPPSAFDQILAALHLLHAEFDTEHSPPTKQGGG
jgi:hypothetical protein